VVALYQVVTYGAGFSRRTIRWGVKRPVLPIGRDRDGRAA